MLVLVGFWITTTNQLPTLLTHCKLLDTFCADADVFESLTEEAIETKIRTAALDEGQYAAIRSDIINILSSQWYCIMFI